MKLPWNRKREKAQEQKQIDNSREVADLKHLTHVTAEKANKDIERLNKLLEAKGITLNIHRASGGHHGR